MTRPLVRNARRRAISAIVAAFVLLAAPAAYATEGRAGDFDNDGRDDLAVGVPDEAVGEVNDAGGVNVLEGSGSGITTAGDILFTQATLGGTVEALDRLGNAVAYGDFDNDGFDDLAVGAPTEDWEGAVDAGVVHIIFGSSTGLNTSDRQVISQFGPMAGANEAGDFFGADLASGDFDNDGFDDLVIGVPGEDTKSAVAAGAIIIAYGSSGGITTTGSDVIGQWGPVPGGPEDFDAFGSVVTVGNFDGDAYDDVAVGVPGEDIGTKTDAGAIHALYGSANGIVAAGDVISQSGPVPGVSEAGDRWGFDIASGDFNADGDDDLIVGAPGEDIGSSINTGAASVLYGSSSGLTKTGSIAINQAGPVPGINETGDEFGTSVAAGDFNNDGDDDIAIGVPKEDIGSKVDAGNVIIIGGNPAGVTTAGSFNISQGPLPNAGTEAGDLLGIGLVVGNFNGDNFDDLVIAATGEDAGSIVDVGIVHIVYGSGNSLDAAGAQIIHQGVSGVEGSLETNDRFGSGVG